MTFHTNRAIENFLTSRLALAYIFLICLFRSRSLFFVEIVIPRHLQPTFVILKPLYKEKTTKNDGRLILIVLFLKHKEND